jgi:small conductance mechanosensitive channel
VVFNVILILAILDIFGVKTNSLAALLAGAVLAIGTAWGGLLTHFVAGIFMQVLRPYKVGDFFTVGGITGTVKELGLFGTTLITPDNLALPACGVPGQGCQQRGRSRCHCPPEGG